MFSIKSFSKILRQKLKYFVYALVDPFTDDIFYIGKGSGNRPFNHFSKNEKNLEKRNRIKSIIAQGNKPKIEIIRYGLSSSEALNIETTLIDAIGLEKLTNLNYGHSSYKGRLKLEVVEQLLGGEPLDVKSIEFNTIFFYCHNAYPKYNLYDSARQFWNVSYKKVSEKVNGDFKFKYAFAMQGNHVLEVYRILEWFEAGKTVSTREYIPTNIKRWEFIGSFAEPKIRKKYKNRILFDGKSPLPAQQIGFRYVLI